MSTITHSKVSAKSDGADNTLIQPSDWNADHVLADGFALMRMATVTLTDAQIKALPTTPVEIIPQPGSGKTIIPLNGVITFNITTGYTNLGWDGIGGIISLYLNIGSILAYTPIDTAGVNSSLAGVNNNSWWMNSGNNRVYENTDPDVVWGIYVAGQGKVFDAQNNTALVLYLDNYTAAYETNLGNLTGGDSANTLKVTVYYTIIDL